MELNEFKELVKEMRTCQKAYFKARSKGENCGDILSRSKELEKKVDVAIKEMDDSKNGVQNKLF